MKINCEMVFNVQLNKREASFLRDITQNYMGENPQDEPLAQQNIRYEIFTKFKEILDYCPLTEEKDSN